MRHIAPLVLLPCLSMACSDGGDAAGAQPHGDAAANAHVDAGSSDSSARDGGPPSTAELFADDAQVWRFELQMSEDDRAWLDANATLEQYVPGMLALQGQPPAPAMVRYKGAYGSLKGCFDDAGKLTCNKLSLKVSFNETDKNGRYLGLRKLLFHACQRDVSCLRERISYGLFRDAGIEVSRAAHATVSINGGAPSLYALVEYVDKEFLQDHFDDDSGNLYKEAWPVHDSAGPYQQALVTNETTADASRFVAFAGAVSASSPATFAADVGAFIDLSRMHRYNAVDELIHDWDGIWKFYCVGGQCGNHNFYVYEDPATQRFVIIPWDLDHTWNKPNTSMGREYFDDSPTACDIVEEDVVRKGVTLGSRAAMCDPLMAGMMIGDRDGYRAALRALLDGEQTSLPAVLGRLDTYRARIRPAIEADPLPPTVEQWEQDVARLRQVIRASYAQAERLLRE